MKSAAPVQATLFPSGETIEFAPGQEIVPIPQELVPRVALMQFVPAGDGTYRPMAKLSEHWVRMTVDLPRKLNLGANYITLTRLMRAGFIKGVQISPKCWLLDLQSLYDHIDAVKADPEFWTGKNHRKYQESL